MTRVTILSPHRDDAAFSLAIAFWKWRQRPVEITVLNFFTQSVYAPHCVLQATEFSAREQISAARKREDRKALLALSSSVRIRSCDLLDAPLRLGIEFGRICDTSAPVREEDVQSASSVISRYARGNIVLAPLALGDHIDHRTVRAAALHAAGRHRIGFYEDLPYATWTAEQEIRRRIAHLEDQLRTALVPSVLRTEAAVPRKERAARRYQTQINSLEAQAIARYAEKYRAGERVWVPRHSGAWRTLLR